MSNDEFESVEETPESIEHEEGRENLEENVDIDSEQSERTEQTEQRIQDQAEQPIEHQEEEQQQNQDEIELKKVEYEDLESDSDFGSFDEASFEDFQTNEDSDINLPTNETSPQSTQISTEYTEKSFVQFREDDFEDKQAFTSKLSSVLNQVFPDTKESHHQTTSTINDLLSERSAQIFSQLSTMPHLRPPNWVKSKIRHNLLISLGIPINLDELATPANSTSDANNQNNNKHNSNSNTLKVEVNAGRRKSISTSDISWEGFNIPEFETLHISPDGMSELIANTRDFLSKVETDNLNNSSRQFLEENQHEDVLSKKLAQFEENYNDLIILASVWSHHLSQLTKDFEIYESVVQNHIGYSQKLRRDEILDNLKKVKVTKKYKKKGIWN
ncbi:predicted protein [Scheffersomyces stipitis CBS 6054]|uniref:Uncharacterized protein n=1 Tax=Scheffersomyces stipitis (strain ATCC 58785 / CBS 6054 / NBRC 10063 / NRRL Y-11545) TaxID=322104 RepID=A3LRL9_PICST|nr:predicted protein [Scheffersomyces stipitis CBS 6054]ABN65760.2 predicted protein [Scheffersomyces stipitis CBS 6054]